MRRGSLLGVLVVLVVAGVVLGGRIEAFASTPEARLEPDRPSGKPVGTSITWRAVPDPEVDDPLAYRLSVGRVSDDPIIKYDYTSKKTKFAWMPMEDGLYNVVLSIRNEDTGEITETKRTYYIQPRVLMNPFRKLAQPQITDIDHPLMALYSAPPCTPGNEMRVVFRRPGALNRQATHWKTCEFGHSVNFYITGMRARSTYMIRHQVRDETDTMVNRGPVRFHKTGAIDRDVPESSVLEPIDVEGTSLEEPILFQSSIVGETKVPGLPLATDFSGEIVWYYRNEAVPWADFSYLTRPLQGGRMLLAGPDAEGEPEQVLREINLAGHVVRETNVGRVNEQLDTFDQEPISGIHHEAIRLDNGHTLIIASTERLMDGKIQGRPDPWFTHQHDARYVDGRTDRLILYDNGNTRCGDVPGSEDLSESEDCHSRGQVLNIDEEDMTVSLAINVDLDNYSAALGSAQALSNGNYHFTSGFQGTTTEGEEDGTRFSTLDEVTPEGTKTFSVETRSWMYRSFRMPDLYTAP